MNSFQRDEVIFGFGWSAKSRAAKSLSFNFRNRKSTSWFNVSNFPMKSNRMTHGRQRSTTGRQWASKGLRRFLHSSMMKSTNSGNVASWPFCRESGLWDVCDICEWFLFRCAHYISCCCWRFCSGRQRCEPFKRVANENEFGEVAQSVFERVIQMASVQHCHGISVVNDRPRNGRQVIIRLNNRLRKDQHEPLQVGAGHLINGIIIIQTHINGSQSDLYVVIARIELIYCTNSYFGGIAVHMTRCRSSILNLTGTATDFRFNLFAAIAVFVSRHCFRIKFFLASCWISEANSVLGKSMSPRPTRNRSNWSGWE